MQQSTDFLPNVVNTAISGEVINKYLTQNCDVSTVLKIKAVELAIEIVTNNRMKQASLEEFQKTFESIYNFINNPK